MRIPRSTTFLVVPACFLCSSASVAYETTAATQTLMAQYPGLRTLVQQNRMTALYGVPFASDANPATDTDAFVTAFINQNPGVFGVDACTLVPDAGCMLELKKKINIGNNKFTVYTYVQKIENLPVYGSIVKIPVLLGPTEKIGYAGMRLVQPPAQPLPPDVITGSAAVATASGSATYGHLTTFTTADKVIHEDTAGTLHRCWRFSGYDDDESYLFLVDTNTGETVEAVDQLLRLTVTGTVSGHATPCFPPDPSCPYCCATDPECSTLPEESTCAFCCSDLDPIASMCCAADNPDNPETCPVVMFLPGAQVSIVGGEQGFALADGSYALSDPRSEFTVESRLIGRWVTVDDVFGNNLLVSGQASSSQSVVDLEFNTSADPNCTSSTCSAEYCTAQVNAFLHVQGTHDWFKNLQPTCTDIDQNIRCVVNIFTVGAAYQPVTQTILFSSSFPVTGQNNFATASVISHEYGHFILDQIIGTPSFSRFNQFHEGVASTISALRLNTPLSGLDVRGDGIPSKNVDSPNVQFGDCSSVPTWIGCTSAHGLALALSGAFWDLQKELRCCADDPQGPCADSPITLCTEDTVGVDCAGGQVCIDRPTEQLFSDFLFVTTGVLDTSVVVEVLIADDNNMDLTDGTPNKTAILDSFVGLHGWCDPIPDPVADGSVEVRWEGPLTGPPDVDVDYRVFYYEGCPPDVTLITTTGTDDRPVVTWFVGRVDPQTGQPLDLGTVSATWEGSPHNITVQVGDPLDPTIQCRDLGTIAPIAQSENNWSGVALDLRGDLIDIAASFGTGGVGGRISGVIDGNAKRIVSEAIGLGSAQSGTLQIAGSLERLDIGTIPSGSLLFASEIDDVAISGELVGDIQISTDLNARLCVEGTGISSGNIVVGNDIVSSSVIDIAGDMTGSISAGRNIARVDVAGDMSGDILADTAGVGTGVISSALVGGTFNGDICGSNLSPGMQLLPSGINIANFGPTGTVCGVTPGCGVALPTDPDPNIIKNRFISFVPGNPATPEETAIRVKLVRMYIDTDEDPVNGCPVRGTGCGPGGKCKLDGITECTDESNCPPPLSTFEGKVRWLGTPAEFNDNSLSMPNFIAASLECTPYYRDWSPAALAADFNGDEPGPTGNGIDGNPDLDGVLHVFGAEIVPCSVYEVQVILFDQACAEGNEASFSAPLSISTALWGDVWVPFEIVNMTDVGKVVDAFKSVAYIPGSPEEGAPPKVRAMLRHNVPPVNGSISFTDISKVVDGFKTIPYKEDGPFSCQSSVACDPPERQGCGLCANDGADCESDADCGGEPCSCEPQDSLCTDPDASCGRDAVGNDPIVCRDKCKRCN